MLRRHPVSTLFPYTTLFRSYLEGPTNQIFGELSRSLRMAHDVSERIRATGSARSEEHTSELLSHVNLVCRLLLEKKKSQSVGSRYCDITPTRRSSSARSGKR